MHNTQQWNKWADVFSTRPARQLRDETVEELLESVFSMLYVRRYYKQDESTV
jgi:hypothetical protein